MLKCPTARTKCIKISRVKIQEMIHYIDVAFLTIKWQAQQQK